MSLNLPLLMAAGAVVTQVAMQLVPGSPPYLVAPNLVLAVAATTWYAVKFWKVILADQGKGGAHAA